MANWTYFTKGSLFIIFHISVVLILSQLALRTFLFAKSNSLIAYIYCIALCNLVHFYFCDAILVILYTNAYMYSIVLRYPTYSKRTNDLYLQTENPNNVSTRVWWKRKWLNTRQSDVNHLSWKLIRDFFSDFKIEL